MTTVSIRKNNGAAITEKIRKGEHITIEFDDGWSIDMFVPVQGSLEIFTNGRLKIRPEASNHIHLEVE